MRYACILMLTGAALFAAALHWTWDILVFQTAIAAVAGGLTWAFLLLKKREAEELALKEAEAGQDRKAA